uniref:Uncharacterized protein n=1 Tax=Oryza rufipogon TaxID=4529 RepID=A0A0E0NHC0_ORYRU
MELAADEDANGLDPSNSVFLFVGEVISRASRRGSTVFTFGNHGRLGSAMLEMSPGIAVPHVMADHPSTLF